MSASRPSDVCGAALGEQAQAAVDREAGQQRHDGGRPR